MPAPNGITGLVGWWTAKRGIGRDGDLVNSWHSQEGDLTLAAPTAVQRPAIVRDTKLFNREVIAYDGVDDLLTNSSLVIAANVPIFIFVVLRYPTMEVGGNSRILNLQSLLADRIELGTSTGPSLDSIRATYAPGTAADAIKGVDFIDDSWFVVCLASPIGTIGSEFDLLINNEVIDTAGIGSQIGADQCHLSSPQTDEFANTRYAEVVIYGGAGVALSAGDFSGLQDYFEDEWFKPIPSRAGTRIGVSTSPTRGRSGEPRRTIRKGRII